MQHAIHGCHGFGVLNVCKHADCQVVSKMSTVLNSLIRWPSGSKVLGTCVQLARLAHRPGRALPPPDPAGDRSQDRGQDPRRGALCGLHPAAHVQRRRAPCACPGCCTGTRCSHVRFPRRTNAAGLSNVVLRPGTRLVCCPCSRCLATLPTFQQNPKTQHLPGHEAHVSSCVL